MARKTDAPSNPALIPLNIAICDEQDGAAELLEVSLRRETVVLDVTRPASLSEAEESFGHDGAANTVFIDPLSLGLDKASKFIFRIRQAFPEVVFVLFVDKAAAERKRSAFFRGERRRFAHYYSLDKLTPAAAFQDELRSVLRTCQLDLSWRMPELSLERLLETAKHRQASATRRSPESDLIQEVRKLVGQLSEKSAPKAPIQSKTVFLSYRFDDEDLIEGLKRLLLESGFEIITGKSTNNFISKAVLDRIKSSEHFLSVMTKHKEKADGTYTTSPWLLEEKGAALAFGKSLVMMIEEGVTDFGGLQGDWQRIHFGPRGFLKAALEAVAQLRSYSGSDS